MPAQAKYLIALLMILAPAASALASGTWTPLASDTNTPLDTPLLLTDGSLMVHSGAFGGTNRNWFRLTPSNTGSYINGTWSTLSPMNDARLFFQTAILPSGDVFVAGGEFTTVPGLLSTTEIYHPATDTWTTAPQVPGTLGDVPSKVLADASGVIIGDIFNTNTYIYHPDTNSWTSGPGKINNDRSNEESWAMLPDGSIINIDCFSPQTTQRYVPTANAWVSAGTLPAPLVDSVHEIGPALQTYDGKVIFFGATGHSAIYTPPAPGALDPGAWAAGPDIPNGLNASDTPGAVEPSGKILFVAGNGFQQGSTLFEYDPKTNTISAALNVPAGLAAILQNARPYETRLLVLPTGQILITTTVNKTSWVYTPDEPADPVAKPIITSITPVTADTFHLTGLQLNGLTEGSTFGDENPNSTNYPLVRLVDELGHVFYATTFNFSSMGVATGNTPVSADFTLPGSLAPGNYTLYVVANGIASDPMLFNPANVPEPASLALLLAALPLACCSRRRA